MSSSSISLLGDQSLGHVQMQPSTPHLPVGPVDTPNSLGSDLRHHSKTRCYRILHSNTNDSDSDTTPSPSECYACTQPGAPAFHSTSCDRAHSPQWAANAGSSLIPIQNTTTTRPTNLRIRAASSWVFGSVLDPRSPRVRQWNRGFLIARAAALAVDPLFFYALSVGRGGLPCLEMDGKLAVAVAAVRTCVDAVQVVHVWVQLRLAYVSSESLVVGCGKLVWDPRMIADHYLRSAKGFWFDLFVILPVPQEIENVS